MSGRAREMRRWKRLIQFVEGLGFQFQRKSSHGFRWKHPNRDCSIQLPGSTSDHRSFLNAKSQIRKILTQDCRPPFDPNDFGEHLSSVRIKLIGNDLNTDMDTLDEVLDRVFADAESYEEVPMNTKMQSQYKNRLKDISARKGITMGELIEEMIEVYETRQ